jgi:hypothetical protein
MANQVSSAVAARNIVATRKARSAPIMKAWRATAAALSPGRACRAALVLAVPNTIT